MRTSVLSTVVFVALISLGVGPCDKKPDPVRSVSQSEAQGLLRNGFAVVIDAREIAAKIATPEGWSEFVRGLPKDKQILVTGGPTTPSGPIAEKIAAEGFKVGDLGTAPSQSP